MNVPLYEHTPIDPLDQGYDLDDPGLKPYTTRGVTIRPELIQGRPWLYLRIASKDKKRLTIKSVDLDGVKVDVNERVEVDTKGSKADVYVASIKVDLSITGDELHKLGEDGFNLKVRAGKATLT